MLTQERVKELFEYSDGRLVRRITTHYNSKKGDTAGCPHGNGYLDVRIDGKRYYVHRVIFLYHHGYLPKYVDHKDTNKACNLISNLRPCSKSENSINRKAQPNNKLGIKNVCVDGNYYNVQVRHSVGFFKYRTKCLELAEFVAKHARERFHGEFANA